MNQSQSHSLRFALQWALESASDPATAAADWLARDICPSVVSAECLLTSRSVTLEQLLQAKDVYKTLRVLGETKADRRVGGMLYLASIAAALVVHGQRISRQNDDTLRRALNAMAGDQREPISLRRLAVEAVAVLDRSAGSSMSSTSSNGSGSYELKEDEDGEEDSLPLEIERTYLLDRLPRLPADADAVRIEQGYLVEGADLQGRLRREIHSDGTSHLTHTIKKGSGLVRSEIERPISKEEFDQHWPATAGQRLTKTRYLVKNGNFTWELDVFDGLNLVLAEVELPTATAIATPPSWLKPHIVREVTHQKQYNNYQLALRLASKAT